MPFLAPDPARPSINDRSADEDRSSTVGPAPGSFDARDPGATADDEATADPATMRLRALLAPGDPWRERAGVARLIDVIDVVGARRAMAVVVAAVVLGVTTFFVVGAGGASSMDPVQVLPRVDPVAARAFAPAAPGDGGSLGAGSSIPAPEPATIRVHAAGAVAAAGVHLLADGSRVADLIQAAGGLAPDADPDRINLASPIHDGERVYLPRRGEAGAPVVVAGGAGGSVGGGTAGSSGEEGAGAPPRTTTTELVDVNAADAAALDLLPGVGPATADAIIRHRIDNGPFRTVEDLQEVPGIGPAKLDRLRDLVSLG